VGICLCIFRADARTAAYRPDPAPEAQLRPRRRLGVRTNAARLCAPETFAPRSASAAPGWRAVQ